MAAIFSMGRWVNITIQWRQDMPLGWSLDSLLMLTSNETSKGNTGGYLSVTQSNDFYSWVNKSCVDKFVQWYNNGSNGHLFTSVSTSWWGEACCLFMMTSSNGNIFRVTGHLCGALTFSLICARINGWVNNREAGDLRRHPTHCDVIVMYYASLWGFAYCVALSAVLNFDCLGDCSPFTSDLLSPTWLIIGIDNKAAISGGKI